MSTALMSRHHEVIAMDHLVAATVAEDGLDFTAFVTGDGTGVGGRIGAEPAPPFAAVAGSSRDPGGEQAGAALQRRHRAVIEGEYAHRVERACDPALPRRARLGAGDEPRGARALLDGGERPEGVALRDHHAA